MPKHFGFEIFKHDDRLDKCEVVGCAEKWEFLATPIFVCKLHAAIIKLSDEGVTLFPRVYIRKA